MSELEVKLFESIFRTNIFERLEDSTPGMLV